MPRRIIGQCHKADFADLLHIGELLERGEEVDLSNLSNRQKVAVEVLAHFNDKGIPIKTLDKIKEVLVWDMGNGKAAIEYKLLFPEDNETRALLQSYR